MKPYYQQDGITIYHGDSHDILPQLESVGLVITDPPWKVNVSSLGDIALWGDMMNGAVFMAWVLCEAKRLTKKEVGAAWMFGSWKTMPMVLRASLLAEWSVESMLIWDKQFPGVGTNQGLRPTYDTIALFCQANFRLANRDLRDIWTYKWNPSFRQFHPAEKPVGLIKQIIEESCKDVILDPFMGSGTTLRAAKDSGRQAIGIEIEERYCEIAANRLSQSVLSL